MNYVPIKYEAHIKLLIMLHKESETGQAVQLVKRIHKIKAHLFENQL